MASNNDEATKQVFSRCLLNCLQVPLWYIFYNLLKSFVFSYVFDLGSLS